jgi:hypothetical protein
VLCGDGKDGGGGGEAGGDGGETGGDGARSTESMEKPTDDAARSAAEKYFEDYKSRK